MPKKDHLSLASITLVLGIVLGILIVHLSSRFILSQSTPIPKPKTTDGSEYSHRQPIAPDFVKLFPKIISRQGDPKVTALALTFDDGPDLKYTPRILDVLKKNNVKATFFVIGTQIQKYPATFKRMVSEGHQIASHGFLHLNVANQTPQRVRNLLNQNNDLIRKNGGPAQTIFRPPYGSLDPVSVKLIGSQGYKIVLWTIDSLDWRGIKQPEVVTNVVPKLKQGYIILQHCAAESKLEDLTGSVQALPEIIRVAKKQGYRFVTVTQLLAESKV